jgi:hypothetical protein
MLPLIHSRVQVDELVARWTGLFGESVSQSFVLQAAIDNKLNLYVANIGLRQVWLELKKPRLLLGKPYQQIKVDAYLMDGFIKLKDYQLQPLLNNKSIEIIFINLHESTFIQGDEPFDLDEIQTAILALGERITITPDDIPYLSVTAEEVAVYEDELHILKCNTEKFLNFFDAAATLKKKLGVLPSATDFYMWCFLGKADGGG